MLQSAGYLVHFAHDRPIQPLNLGAGLQVHDAVAEQIERLFAYLLRIVPGFQHPVLVQCIPNAVKLPQEFVVVFGHLFIVVPFADWWFPAPRI